MRILHVSAIALAVALGAPASAQQPGAPGSQPGTMGSSPVAIAQKDDVLIEAGTFKYALGPASLQKGAEFSVLYGDPSAEGLFAMRLRLPSGYHIAPHHHSQPEVVTVISGSFLVGKGEEASREAAKKLQPGGFFAFQPGHVHYAYAGDSETVVQLNSTGPWTITYADPTDDPRRTN